MVMERTAIEARLRRDVPLASLCTLELGGPAAFLLDAVDEADIVAALRWSEARGCGVWVLGGGSNVVIADDGFAGLVVRPVLRGVEAERDGELVLLTAAAGEPWDTLVARSVDEGWSGLECLSGIPGSVGATPIQNVGAYGQEVADTIACVRVLDRELGSVRTLERESCGFGYRTSVFRRAPERFVILAVTFALRAGGAPTIRYPELERSLAGAPATLATTRHSVLRLRRAKSMVLEDSDPNRRSVGSFFLNPVLATREAESVIRRAIAAGLVGSGDEVPRFPVAPGRLKLPAAWLVERAGFPPGTRRGQVGLSTAHSLALVHHGGGRTSELIAFAREIRAAVEGRFALALEAEPRFVGFAADPLV